MNSVGASKFPRLIKGLGSCLLFVAFFNSCSFEQEQDPAANENLQVTGNQPQSAATTSSFDVNDLSILYPLKKRHQQDDPGRLVKLTDGEIGLMSQQQFRAILNNFKTNFGLDFFGGGAQAEVMNSLDKWALVGLRIDHCARFQLTDPCKDEIRVVAQPVDNLDSTTGDFAMHLIYKPKVTAGHLLGKMIRIREQFAQTANKNLTIGKPLGVHPILAKEGLDSPFARALRDEFILKELSANNLIEVAVSFIEPNRLQPWVFFSASTNDLGRPLANNIFMFDPGTTANNCGVERGRMVCRKDFGSGRIVDTLQKTAGNPNGNTPSGFTPNGAPYLDDFLTLTLQDPDPRTFNSAKKNEAMWARVFNTIENPNLTTVLSTNCTACHRTLTDRDRFAGILNLDTTGPGSFQPAGNSGCTPGKEQEKTGSIKTFNIRVFGYLHSDAMISQRVVNETLQVCEHFKTLFN